MPTTNKNRRPTLRTVLIVQAVLLTAITISLASHPGNNGNPLTQIQQKLTSQTARRTVPIPQNKPLQIGSLYDDPTVISHTDLHNVLKKIRPQFHRKQLKPNFVEHALRTWSIDAKFADSTVLSGIEMRDLLIDHSHYLRSWSKQVNQSQQPTQPEIAPLLQEETNGISVRWGRSTGASVHHDHLLASLTEAGVSLETPVFPPGGTARTFNEILQQSLQDFRLDEREVEWSAMAFGLWLAPTTNSWINSQGRKITFDLIARRLIRGHQRFGVCGGTHRLYSLALLLRIDKQHEILSDETTTAVLHHLRTMRDRLNRSQFPDGHWPSNWSDGLRPGENPIDDADYKKVIATGHHLEWLAIAPKELHPEHHRIQQAAKWLVNNVREKSTAEILKKYTFYSHVATALSAWRQTTPSDFWHQQIRQ